MKYFFKLLSPKTTSIIGLILMFVSISLDYFKEYNYNQDWFFKVGALLSILGVLSKIFPEGLFNKSKKY